MTKVLYRCEDKELALNMANPTFETVCFRFIQLCSQSRTEMDEKELKKELVRTLSLITQAYNPHEWEDYPEAAVAWGVIEVCQKCKSWHTPVGSSCEPILDLAEGLALSGLTKLEKHNCTVCLLEVDLTKDDSDLKGKAHL